MAQPFVEPVLRHLSQVLDSDQGPGASDAELLERFVRRRDAVAFELLMWRHQRLVLGVCRRVVRDPHDAEDAFQAAFLALVRKADTLGHIQSVAGWLHRVAYHVALRARKGAAKRPRSDCTLDTASHHPNPEEDAGRRDLAAILFARPALLRTSWAGAVLMPQDRTDRRHLPTPVAASSPQKKT